MKYLKNFTQLNESNFPPDALRLMHALNKLKEEHGQISFEEFRKKLIQLTGDPIEIGFNDNDDIIADANSGWKYTIGVTNVDRKAEEIELPVKWTDYSYNY